MREDLLEVLAEPGTGSALDLVVTRRGGDGGAEILDGTLTSRQTGKTFAITNGIPRFVPAENYADSFGMQWNRFRKVQLDSVNGTAMSRDRFTSETGWAVSDLKDKWTLDMGCGAGRFAEVAASGDSRFVGLDISSAVEATRDTLRERFPRAEVVQGDILNPPFRHGSFDYVYCLGVLQHTPDNAGGVRSVVRMTKKGGRFAMTIYGRRPWTKLNTKYLIRPLTKRLPAQALLAGIEKVMPVAFPLTDKLFRLPIVGRVAQFTIPIYNYTSIGALNDDDKLRYDFAVLDTFDGLAPAHDHPMTAGEVERAIRDVGAASFDFQTRIPVVVSGTR